jgi:hypothetical protein
MDVTDYVKLPTFKSSNTFKRKVYVAAGTLAALALLEQVQRLLNLLHRRQAKLLTVPPRRRMVWCLAPSNRCEGNAEGGRAMPGHASHAALSIGVFTIQTCPAVARDTLAAASASWDMRAACASACHLPPATCHLPPVQPPTPADDVRHDARVAGGSRQHWQPGWRTTGA